MDNNDEKDGEDINDEEKIFIGYYHKFCRWTGWVNNWDATFSYFVPRNYVIRGINSIHSNSKE